MSTKWTNLGFSLILSLISWQQLNICLCLSHWVMTFQLYSFQQDHFLFELQIVSHTGLVCWLIAITCAQICGLCIFSIWSLGYWFWFQKDYLMIVNSHNHQCCHYHIIISNINTTITNISTAMNIFTISYYYYLPIVSAFYYHTNIA